MAGPIIFYFDFASPYAYFALDRIEEIGRTAGREVEWRPVLVWAIFRELGIATPTDVPAKRDYMFADMKRSADYFGIPYRHPAKMPASAHLATRLYLSIADRDSALGRRLGRALFDAFFRDERDITEKGEVLAVAAEAGIDAASAEDGMNGPRGRELLAAGIAQAVADGVIGSPFFIIDGERFFGADRLPQINWRLGHG
jgi:2-hydroxychromene-2-carboxylate isomerase